MNKLHPYSSFLYLPCVLALLLFSTLSHAAAGDIPRRPDGKPDLQGVWTNASLTRLQRDRQFDSLIIEGDQLKNATHDNPQNVRKRTDDGLDPNDGLLDGKDLARGRGYNAFWIDPGSEYGQVKGTYRTSWIVDPANGRIPFSESGRKQMAAVRRPSNFNGPEFRPLGERCLIGFGGTGGPPMLNVLYNNNYRFVQTPDYLMILVEMDHDARIIPIVVNAKAARHHPAQSAKWLGDSVAYWDGDTLVVETINVRAEQANTGPVYLSPQGKVIERFSRYSQDQILYEFTVEDPVYYSQPWRGEMSFNASDKQVYEYACHEGNYAMEGVLAGARAQEAANNN